MPTTEIPGAFIEYIDPTMEFVIADTFDKVPGYESLAAVLRKAYDQASTGKGNDRHSTGQTFDKQPILTIQGVVGPGFALGQAMKKMEESLRLPPESDLVELLGAINYVAAAYIHLERVQCSDEQSTEQ